MKKERRVYTPADILERAKSGESTTGLMEGRVAVETWNSDDLEIRATDDGMSFRGYAAVFNSWSEDLGGFRERIRPGAFGATLKQTRAIKMFWNHNQDIALGSTRSSLRLTEDDKGLLSENRFPDTTAGRDMGVLVRDKIVDSMSFGFQTLSDAWNENYTERELIEIRLFEVSPVTGWPAYPATSASVRDLALAAGVEADVLAAAFRVLREDDARLTDEQHAALFAAINAKYDKPLRRSFTEEEEAMYRVFSAALNQ